MLAIEGEAHRLRSMFLATVAYDQTDDVCLKRRAPRIAGHSCPPLKVRTMKVVTKWLTKLGLLSQYSLDTDIRNT